MAADRVAGLMRGFSARAEARTSSGGSGVEGAGPAEGESEHRDARAGDLEGAALDPRARERAEQWTEPDAGDQPEEVRQDVDVARRPGLAHPEVEHEQQRRPDRREAPCAGLAQEVARAGLRAAQEAHGRE